MQRIAETHYYIKITESPRTGNVRTQLYMTVGDVYIKVLHRDAPTQIKQEMGFMRYDFALSKFKAHLYD